MHRREFLKSTGLAAAGLAVAAQQGWAAGDEKLPFKISLAEWSLHRTIFSKQLDHLEFAATAKKEYGIEAVEYVNQFFRDKAKDQDYLKDMKQRAADNGVSSQLIMIDGEGALGDADEARQKKAVDNHIKWIEAAKFLDCHSIRVNAQSQGTYEEQQKRAADGLRKLSELAAEHQVNVLVENHGGYSSNGEWLAGVIKEVGLPNCGTLPDFGNFSVSLIEKYDRYKGVTELMPYAKAVSAKSHDFDDEGNEKSTDYAKMLKIVTDAGYHGYVGIEYEGGRLSEPDGIQATKKLLERVRQQLAG